MRVLLVEDESNLRGLIQRVLEEEGHQVAVAATVHRALALASGRTFDVALCDEGLPDGSGRTVLRHLRHLHGDGIRTLLMTGDLFHRGNAEEPVLLKPFRFTRLIELLQGRSLATAPLS